MKLNQHLAQSQLIFLENKHNAQISVHEDKYYRWLAFDDVIQSVMLKRRPEKLTLPHQYAALLPLLFFRPNNIVELGLGGGNLTRFLAALHPNIHITSIELSPTVIQCCSQYFQLPKPNIKIEQTAALAWLNKNSISKEQAIDWLICDVYQHHTHSFEERVKLISALVENLDAFACLTINLPDLSDSEINLCLTILAQLQSTHNIIYFHIPRYLNVIIHLTPKSWPINHLKKRNKNSYLSKTSYQRWRKLFAHHLTTSLAS